MGRSAGTAVLVTAVAIIGTSPASAATADRPGPVKLYDPTINVHSLQPTDFAEFSTPADFAKLPSRVRDAALTPATTVTISSSDALDVNRSAARSASAVSELCLTQWRYTCRKSLVGLTLMTVQNKMYGCSDGIYFTGTPIDLSSAKGAYGWAFTGWRDSAVGFCSATHLKWVQVKTAKFKYALFQDFATLSNQTVFFGRGGQLAGAC